MTKNPREISVKSNSKNKKWLTNHNSWLSLIFVVLIISNYQKLEWAINQYSSTTNGNISLIFLIILIFIVVKKTKKTPGIQAIEKQENTNPVGAPIHRALLLKTTIIALFMTFIETNYNILNYLILIIGSFFILNLWTKIVSSVRTKIYLGLLVSAPIIPLLGSTFGMIFRGIYANLLSPIAKLIDPNVIISGTSFVSHAKNTIPAETYQFTIDSSCSGVQGLYIISFYFLFLALQKSAEKLNYRLYLTATLLYLLLNFIRIIGLYVAHNHYQITNLDWFDNIWGIINLLIIFIYLFKKTERTILKLCKKNHSQID